MEAGKGSRKHTCLDQYPGMRVHQTDPLNVGAPLEVIRQAFVTPQDCFFVRNHGAMPHVDRHRYRLIVTGRVQVLLALSLDELRAQFPASTVMATLQCAGHRRAELAAFRPIPGEIPWGAETIGNAVWRGVALREVLQAAGVGESAQHVAFLGLDALHKGREPITFGRAIPIEKGMRADGLLAYQTNWSPLPPHDVFPLRGLVLG